MPVPIDAELVQRLLRAQFPEYGHLPVAQVRPGGHDNRTFRVGEQLAARLPSAAPYAPHLALEHECLPRLAGRLPVRIPEPVALGAPGCGYPWCWALNRWIPGDPFPAADLGDLDALARDLAGFLRALHAADAAGAPTPGADNFHRGGDLAVYEGETLTLIDRLGPLIDAPRARHAWQSARATRWRDAPVWVHGDLAPDNLLFDGGRLHGVIDFGQLAAGDPACDLTIAWTLLDQRGRATFASCVGLDEGTWARARGWALWKQLLILEQAGERAPDEARRARRMIGEICGGPYSSG